MAPAQGRDLSGAASSGTPRGGWRSWATPARRRVARRASKVALAATIATLIAELLELPVPWFATISAIVAVEVTLRVSVRAARNAVVGAVVGALVGLALATVAKDQVWAVGVVVLVSFVVFGLAKMEQVGRQAALVASVIVLIPSRSDLTTPQFAGVRLLETLIGIVVALVVNATVLPPRAFRGARRHLGEAYTSLATMYRLVVAAEASGVRDATAVVAARRSFRASLRQVDELWDEALSERPTVEELAPHWRATTRRIWELCTAMDDAVMDAAARGPLAPARAELGELAEATADALDTVAAVLTGGDGAPLPPFDDLEERRRTMLRRVRDLEVHSGDLGFSQSLQVFTFVNSMSLIAVRLTELAVPGEGAPLHGAHGSGSSADGGASAG